MGACTGECTHVAYSSDQRTRRDLRPRRVSGAAVHRGESGKPLLDQCGLQPGCTVRATPAGLRSSRGVDAGLVRNLCGCELHHAYDALNGEESREHPGRGHPPMPIDGRTGSCSVRLALVVALGSTTLACETDQSDDVAHATPAKDADVDADLDRASTTSQVPVVSSDWRPTSRNDEYAGETVEHWALLWARWFLSQSACQSASDDLDGSLCTLYQDFKLPVFFLGAGEYDTTRTECRIPRDRAVLVPLIQFVSDLQEFPPDYELGEFDPALQAARVFESMRDLVLVVDNGAVEESVEWGVAPMKFEIELPPATNFYSCSGLDGVEGTVGPLYVTGYFVLLPPPAPGKHRIEYGGTLSYPNLDYVQRVTTTFVVE